MINESNDCKTNVWNFLFFAGKKHIFASNYNFTLTIIKITVTSKYS